MEITEVRIFLRGDAENRKLRAYATVTFDNAFVVRNVKVIEGNNGLFIAMPSRKLKESCPKCGQRNALRSKYCNQCGASIAPAETQPAPGTDSPGETRGRESEHRDIAHPITPEFREYLQKKVLDTYEADRAKQRSEAAPGAESPSPEPAV